MNSEKSNQLVVVACFNASGESDLFATEVRVSQDELDNGQHYSLAEDKAQQEGYSGPYVCYDQAEHGAIEKMSRFLQFKSRPHDVATLITENTNLKLELSRVRHQLVGNPLEIEVREMSKAIDTFVRTWLKFKSNTKIYEAMQAAPGYTELFDAMDDLHFSRCGSQHRAIPMKPLSKVFSLAYEDKPIDAAYQSSKPGVKLFAHVHEAFSEVFSHVSERLIGEELLEQLADHIKKEFKIENEINPNLLEEYLETHRDTYLFGAICIQDIEFIRTVCNWYFDYTKIQSDRISYLEIVEHDLLAIPNN